MALIERLSNIGYYAVGKETTAGTAVTPTTYLPGYKDSLLSNLNLDEMSPIVGVRALRYLALMGQRSHEGVLTLQAEPNTSEYIWDMLLTQGGITGGGPYTHPFTVGSSNSYTLDVGRGQLVERFFGVQAQSVDVTFNKNEMRYDVDLSALGSFKVGQIATVATTTITLDTAYDPAPTKGLVVSDVVRIMKADGSTTLDTTIATVNADGITLVLGASAAAYSAGDFIFLRLATPSLTILPPFNFARTQFQFATTASSALSAAQTNLESGSKWKLSNMFEKKGGSDRSGSFDPISLVRTMAEAQMTVKVFFDQPQDLNRFMRVTGQACVVRHYVVSGGNTYELRVTLNNIIQKASKRPLETGKIVYNEIDYEAFYNTSDAQVYDVKVINNLAA